jgi:ribosomal protein S12 methylthiotransferase accessory factor
VDTGEPVYLPAFAAFLSAELAHEALCEMTSNGLGAGPTIEAAAQRAELDLRERDAFVTSWLTWSQAVRLQQTPRTDTFRQIAERLETQGAQLETYLVAHGDPVYVAVSAGLGDGVRWPSVTLGLGVGFTPAEAIDKAILEHGQTGPVLANTWKTSGFRAPKKRSDVHTLEDHALYYCDPAHRDEFDQWRLGVTEHAKPARRAEVRIAVADLTPPELSDSPFRVARALARGLQPIHCGYGLERVYTDGLNRLLKGAKAHAAPLPIA